MFTISHIISGYLIMGSVCQSVKEDRALEMLQGLAARATLLHQKV